MQDSMMNGQALANLCTCVYLAHFIPIEGLLMLSMMYLSQIIDFMWHGEIQNLVTSGASFLTFGSKGRPPVWSRIQLEDLNPPGLPFLAASLRAERQT